jgi:hypothetical protein
VLWGLPARAAELHALLTWEVSISMTSFPVLLLLLCPCRFSVPEEAPFTAVLKFAAEEVGGGEPVEVNQQLLCRLAAGS